MRAREILGENANGKPVGGLNRVWLDHPVYGKETVGEYLKRHKIPISDEGKITLYHGRPKGSDYTNLRVGSYLADSPDDAAHFAGRDRGLKPDSIEVIKLELNPDDIEPGSFITLRKTYEILREETIQVGRYSEGPRYWYHSLRGRKLNSAGGIDGYPFPPKETELAREFRDWKDGDVVVYLSQTPLSSDALKIDASKLDTIKNLRYTSQAEGYAIHRGPIPKEAIVGKTITEKASRGRPIVCVDVQPAYASYTPSGYNAEVAKFLADSRGPILMYVNADETGITEDNVEHDIHPFWEELFEHNGDDFYEDGLDKMEFFDKGYGYLRSWMDNNIQANVIIKTIREMYRQKVSDSRELFSEAEDYEQAMEEFLGSDYDPFMLDDPLSVGWTAMDQLKRYNNCYLIGGGREECLKEVALLMNAFNIKYTMIENLIY